MKKFLIIFSIMTVCFLAYFDAKDRLDELSEIAATTPAQVELQQNMNKPQKIGVPNNSTKVQQPNFNNTPKTIQQDNEYNSTNRKNQFNSVQDRRRTITNPSK